MSNFSKKSLDKILCVATALLLINDVDFDVCAAEEQTGLDVINALEESQQGNSSIVEEGTTPAQEIPDDGGITALPLGEMQNQAPQNSEPVQNNTQSNQQNQSVPIEQQNQPTAQTQNVVDNQSPQGSAESVHFIDSDGTVFSAPSNIVFPPEMLNKWIFTTNDIASVEQNLNNAQNNANQIPQNQTNQQMQNLPQNGSMNRMPNNQQAMDQQPNRFGGQMQQQGNFGSGQMTQQGQSGFGNQMQQPGQNNFGNQAWQNTQQMTNQQPYRFGGQMQQQGNFGSGQMTQQGQNGFGNQMQQPGQNNMQQQNFAENGSQKNSIMFRCREVNSGNNQDPNSKILECSVM